METRDWMQAVLLVFLLILGLAWQAAAEPRPLGDWCWRMYPFADTVLARVYTGETLDGEPHVPLTYNFWWLGLTEYSLSGGGTGTINYSGQLITLQAVAHNTRPFPYFRGNPIMEFKAVMSLDTFTGRWTAHVDGALIDGQPPHEGGGYLQPIDCAEHGQLPSAQVSRSQSSPQEGNLLALD
jgi:hypothetical protein